MNGYILDLVIDEGKSEKKTGTYKLNSLFLLTKKYPVHNHILHPDSRYTSIPLCYAMKKVKIGIMVE
jgi:hypothetical protein